MSTSVSRKKRAPRKAGPRPYRSALRESQAEATREAILAAAEQEMAARGPAGFSVGGVAERSGVALRTVYRHFPTRDELVDAMWAWMYARRDWLERLPRGPIEDTVAGLGRGYAETRDLIRAAQRCERQNALRVKTRPRRMAAFLSRVEAEAAPLGPAAQRMAVGALHNVTTPSFWLLLNDSWCPDPEEASRAAAWAFGVLLEKIRSDPEGVEAALGAGSGVSPSSRK